MSKLLGIDFFIHVNSGTVSDPVWKLVAGQRGATLNRGQDTADTTTKDGDGWAENQPTIKNWGVDADGLIVKDDEGYAALEQAFNDGEQILVRYIRGDGTKKRGLCTITDFPEEAPYDSEATYSVTLLGSGPLVVDTD